MAALKALRHPKPSPYFMAALKLGNDRLAASSESLGWSPLLQSLSFAFCVGPCSPAWGIVESLRGQLSTPVPRSCWWHASLVSGIARLLTLLFST